MKIAQVAPLIESVPPRLYRGTERIVSYLTEELVRRDHEVTLFASGDSITSAELSSCCTRALRLGSERARHSPAFHATRSLEARTLTTLHGRQDLGDLSPSIIASAKCRWCPSPAIRKAWESRPAAGSGKRPDAGGLGDRELRGNMIDRYLCFEGNKLLRFCTRKERREQHRQ